MTIGTRATALLRRQRHCWAFARLVRETVRVCLRYRVTGLASEAGFFALLSLPPLVLAVFAALGFIGRWIGTDRTDAVAAFIETQAGTVLSGARVADVIVPTVDEVLRGGRADLVSIGFLLALWSGSRALNVYLDTISIMYGQSGVRGIVRTRAMSFSLFTLVVIVAGATIPLLVAGALWLRASAPASWGWVDGALMGGVALIALLGVTTLFHLATPRRTPWRLDLPGAVLTVVLWALSSYVVHAWLGEAIGGTSIYGPLAAPIVLLVWLYFLAIEVLIGAACNAAIRTLWPVRARNPELVRERAAKLRAVPTAPAAARSPWGPVLTGLVAPRPAPRPAVPPRTLRSLP